VRHRPRAVRTLIFALTGALAAAGGATAAVGAMGSGPEDVSVTVTSLRNARGSVVACLTAKPVSFPDCSKDAASRHLAIPASAKAVQLDFGAVAPGTYAVSLFHDENGNGKLDTVMMIPREGFGFSRDAKVRFGPPRFAAAAFTVEGEPVKQTVRMRYLF